MGCEIKEAECICITYAQFLREISRETGLEPATSAVTGRCSNQLNYSRK